MKGISHSAGIATVAYGSDYDRCAAHTMLYSRKFTDLPFVVVTNVPEERRCKKWSDVSGVEFVFVNASQKDNRLAKLQMDLFSPFDKTLYIDADSVIQKPGVEKFVDALGERDVCLQHYVFVGKRDPIWVIYAKHMRVLGATKPITLYHGGCVAFRRGDSSRRFYSVWIENWKKTGGGRDMPSLACAAKTMPGVFNVFPQDFFLQDSSRSVVVHNADTMFGFCERFGVPKWNAYHPSDVMADLLMEKKPSGVFVGDKYLPPSVRTKPAAVLRSRSNVVIAKPAVAPLANVAIGVERIQRGLSNSRNGPGFGKAKVRPVKPM